MKSSAYYVRKGLRYSIHFYLKNPSKIILCLIMEIARLITLPFLFLIPAFNKMQFNYTKMILETGKANYAKSFDDADKNYLNRFLFSTIFIIVSIALSGSIYLLYFGISKFVLNIFAQFSSDITNVESVLSYIQTFVIILCAVVFVFCLINFYVGIFISCASNSLSLGDVFYNTFLTMKKNVGKIVLVFLLYLLIFVSYVFLFGLPTILIHYFLNTSHHSLYLAITSILFFVFFLLLIVLGPIYLTAMRVSFFDILDSCAELDERVVIAKRRDIRGNSININVLPYEEKSKRLEIDVNELGIFKKGKNEHKSSDRDN